MPSLLRDATARAALRLTMHGPSALVGTAAARAIILAEGASKTMAIMRLKAAAVVVTMTGIGTAAIAVFAGSDSGAAAPVRRKSQPPSTAFPLGESRTRSRRERF